MSSNYEYLNKKAQVEMYDVKLKRKMTIEVDLVKLSNGRFAVTGKNPDTGMTMFKLVSKVKAQEILGQVIV